MIGDLSPFTHVTYGVHRNNFPFDHLQGRMSQARHGRSLCLLNVGKLLPFCVVYWSVKWAQIVQKLCLARTMLVEASGMRQCGLFGWHWSASPRSITNVGVVDGVSENGKPQIPPSRVSGLHYWLYAMKMSATDPPGRYQFWCHVRALSITKTFVLVGVYRCWLTDLSKEVPAFLCSVGIFKPIVVGACPSNLMHPKLFHSSAVYDTSVRNFVVLFWFWFALDNFKDFADV